MPFFYELYLELLYDLYHIHFVCMYKCQVSRLLYDKEAQAKRCRSGAYYTGEREGGAHLLGQVGTL